MNLFKNQNIILFILVLVAMFAPWWVLSYYGAKYGNTAGTIMFTAFFLGGMLFLATFVIFLNLGKRMEGRAKIPKVIVDNFKKKQAPFYDATGAHAGALLGDVLHDPFQCYSSVVKLKDIDGKDFKINEKIDGFFQKYKHKILRKKERNYEAIHLPKNELQLLGETNGSISPVEILSCNRHDYNGNMIKLTTSENKELIVTPEHKIAVWKNNEVAYVEAKYIKENDEIVSKAEDIIIDEQDIINTYDERQQEQCRLYYQYLEIKEQNTTWGYKRIAKAMGQNIGKIRWWHARKHIPVPIQTANWLKEHKLLPLKIDNPKLPLISKVLGATFGDGGIFENLNAIFLSSSNVKDTEEFSKDMQQIFGKPVILNAELREGGEYGHSWCMSNTNRNVIRFFVALQAPVGNKSVKELMIPSWIKINEKFKDEFYGSLFGSELGVSYKYKKYLPRIEFAITGSDHLEHNRTQFLNEIISYLRSRGVEMTNRNIDISAVNTSKGRKNNKRYRFILSQYPLNTTNFIENIKINYCNLKKCKLYSAYDSERRSNLIKYLDLRSKDLGAEEIMKKLDINAKYLYKLLNSMDADLQKVEATT
jgi:Lon-like ATP-dependent protease